MAMVKPERTAQIPVLLLGCGGVGQQFIAQILKNRELHSSLNVEVSVVGVVDSSAVAFPGQNSSLTDVQLQAITSHKGSKRALVSLDLDGVALELEPSEHQIVTHLKGGILVDCTAQSTENLLSLAVKSGACAVLANKKPITASMDSYRAIVSAGRRFRNESTVGAGLPIMAALERMKNSGDSVHKVMGALSGTLGYVMSGLQDGKSFSDVVRVAKSLGYTEPDPRDDLSGLDVARKALIMARSLGWELELSDIEIESLYPESMAKEAMSVAEFLETGLLALDAALRDRADKAAGAGHVLRYVALLEGGRCAVGLAEVPADSPLGRLRGSDNLMEISSQCYSVTPLMISGAGAGNETTAAGVLADVIDMKDLFVH